MIKEIKELNLPDYATLRQATCTLQHMAEKTITTQIKINGVITPDFSYDWEVEFQGEKYIMPLRKPQGAKENTSLNSTIDLTFQHWAMYQLKRWYFFTVQSVESGTAIADKYNASVSLNLGDFCVLFGQVLQYYFGDRITIDLNPEWEYSTEPVGVEISYSYLWDVLIQLYELYAVRWSIEPATDNSNTVKDGERYIIKVGYPTTEMSHIFEYGFEGGLLKVERQVQDDNIRNILLGRGGEKNLPYRYFKDVDPQNESFSADPDWIPELRNIYFDRLRGKTFRDYIKGWKTNPNRQLTNSDGTAIKPYGSSKPIEVEEYDEEYAKTSFAYMLGHTDAKFNPVEYVADKLVVADLQVIPDEDSSIANYGKLLGGLEDNDDIYPSIQGVTVDPYGRIDEAVDVELIESDDIEAGAESDAVMSDVEQSANSVAGLKKTETAKILLTGDVFKIDEGLTGDFLENTLTVTYQTYAERQKLVVDSYLNGRTHWETIIIKGDVKPNDGTVEVLEKRVWVVNTVSGEEHSATGIPSGTWRYMIEVEVKNNHDSETLIVVVACENGKVVQSSGTGDWTNTWNVWVKNIWGTSKKSGESDEAYAERVWRPILSDRTGSEATLVFSDGLLSTSEDYEFVITKIPQYERKTCQWQTMVGSEPVTHQYESEWKITLAKCDADLESTGLYIPSTMRQAKAGDHFFFTGIDMPHQYVLWAEERLDSYKSDQLKEVSDIKPTWVVGLDKVRINTLQEDEVVALISQLRVGCPVRLADKRFIVNSAGTTATYETLYIQSVTYTYNEPQSDSVALLPDTEIVLGDKYETSANPVDTLSGEVSSIAKQLSSISNVEQIVRAVGDKLYLRKDGLPERSMSPTEFGSLLTSPDFRSGIVGGQGWGFFKDNNGNWVLEADRVNVRQEMQVNNLVINQIEARGGMVIESAANIEVTRVVEVSDGYECFFDTKNGSVYNMFKVGDVGYCNRFTAENENLKFYKRMVTAVSGNSVTLSKTETNGDGIPSEGDVIVHYGNYTDANRQYVKVRDVVGGGYERYIEGLDSVDATGTEYYFIGRQDGMYENKPRWYVGGEGSFIEYVDGKFSLNNVSLSVGSTVGEQSIEMYVADKLGFGVTNIVLDSERTLLLTNNPTTTEAVYDLSEDLLEGEDYTVSLWGDPTTYHQPVRLYFNGNQASLSLKKQKDGLWRATFEATAASNRITITRMGSTEFKALKVKMERGLVGTDWSPSPKDEGDELESMSYLKRALKESTLVDGGLVVASLLQLGYTTDENGYVVRSGVNGIYSNDAKGGGVAFWAGGNMVDAGDTQQTEEATTPATFAVRMDGTGYMANNTIRFDENRLMLGDNMVIESDELRLITDDGDMALIIRKGDTGFTANDMTATVYEFPTDQRKLQLKHIWFYPPDKPRYMSTTIEQGTQTYKIGEVDANAKILVVVSASFDLYKNYDANSVAITDTSRVCVDLIDSAGNETTIGCGRWGGGGAVPIYNSEDTIIGYNFKLYIEASSTVTAEDTFSLAIRTATNWEDEYVSDLDPIYDQINFNVDITIDGSRLHGFIIGGNGITANWGKSLFCADANGVAMRYGQKWIKVVDDDIRVGNGNDSVSLIEKLGL